MSYYENPYLQFSINSNVSLENKVKYTYYKDILMNYFNANYTIYIKLY